MTDALADFVSAKIRKFSNEGDERTRTSIYDIAELLVSDIHLQSYRVGPRLSKDYDDYLNSKLQTPAS